MEKSDALEFVEKMRDKEKTLLEGNGANLSGGQRQRIALARAFINKPQIKILENIYNFSKQNKITTMISAQKASSLRKCDRIIVLNNGKIEQIGSHTELKEKSNIYKEILQLQRL